MTPAELLAAAKKNIEDAVQKEVDGLLKLVRGCLEKDPYEKYVRITYAYDLDDICARGVEFALGQLGYRARFVRRMILSDYFEISGWHDAKPTTPDGSPYRAVQHLNQT